MIDYRLLNANQIKILALAIMTFDHIGAFMYTVPFVASYYPIFRIVGRIAAPLFLFLVIESVRHTSNRIRFALRLYIANLVMVAMQITVNTALGPYIGVMKYGNIFQTFLLTVLVICFIDLIVKAIKERSRKALLQGAVVALLLVVPVLVYFLSIEVIFSLPNLSSFAHSNIFDAVMAVFPCILIVEYTPLFVLMAVIWYYTNNRLIQVANLILFAWFAGSGVLSQVPYINTFSSPNQLWMFMAAPFMLLYNGKKGGGGKYFFYVYYIVHQFVLVALARLLS